MMSASFTVALPSHSPSLLLVHFLPTCLGFTEAVSEEVGGEARGARAVDTTSRSSQKAYDRGLTGRR